MELSAIAIGLLVAEAVSPVGWRIDPFLVVPDIATVLIVQCFVVVTKV